MAANTGAKPRPTILAAGGLVLRDETGTTEVALVHRPRRDDWSYPKGKFEKGETAEQCALREVEEETGLVCSIIAPGPEANYVDDAGRRKHVSYFLMAIQSGDFQMNPEVDELRFVPLEDAAGLLTYEQDRAIARELVASLASG